MSRRGGLSSQQHLKARNITLIGAMEEEAGDKRPRRFRGGPSLRQVSTRQQQSFQARPLLPAPGSVCMLSCPHWEEHSRPSGATISSDLSPPPAASLRDFWPELGVGQLLRAQETSGSRREGSQGEPEMASDLEGPLSRMPGQNVHWTWSPSWTRGQEPGAVCRQ